MGFPQTNEKETWGDEGTPGHPTFRVGQRIFVILSTDGDQASIRTTIGEQVDLMSAFPDACRPASHVGRFGWVEVDLAGIDDVVLREIVERAWARTAPKRVATAWAEGRR